MTRGTVLALLGGTALGGLIAYELLMDESVEAFLESWRKKGVPLRVPEPGFDMQLARVAADFEFIDDELCACLDGYPMTTDGEPTSVARPVAPSDDELVEYMQLCVAQRLFPDFPWPPVPGDHPSVGELWSDLRTLARRSVALRSCAPTLEASP